MGKKLEVLWGERGEELIKHDTCSIIAAVIKILTMQTVLLLIALKCIKVVPVAIRF